MAPYYLLVVSDPLDGHTRISIPPPFPFPQLHYTRNVHIKKTHTEKTETCCQREREKALFVVVAVCCGERRGMVNGVRGRAEENEQAESR